VINLFDEELKERGYVEFKPGPLDHSEIETKFQKRFDDEIGKKYFITVDKWRALTHPYTGEKFDPGYEFTTQFTFCGNPVNINCFSGWNIEEAENKIEEMWQKCMFDYYEVFDKNEVERRVPRDGI